MRRGVREKLPEMSEYSPVIIYKVVIHTCSLRWPVGGGVVGGQQDAEGRLQALTSVRSGLESPL